MSNRNTWGGGNLLAIRRGGIAFIRTMIVALALLATAAHAYTKHPLATTGTDAKREPTAAVRVWKNTTQRDDGRTIVAAYINVPASGDATTESVKTSVSSDGGTIWSDQPDLPLAPTEDEKLACRVDASGNPEVIAAYRTPNTSPFHTDKVYLTFSGFSSVDGLSWSTPGAPLGPSMGPLTRRPCLVADNSETSTLRNNAYVAWTEIDESTGQSWVLVSTLTRLTRSNTTPMHIATNPDYVSCSYVDACDITVDASGVVYVLWRKIYSGSYTFDLMISKSTDGGSTWSSPFTVVTGKTLSPKLNYYDYPALTISRPGCSGTESAFVAFTDATTTQALRLTSSGLSFTSWSTPFDVNAVTVGKPIPLASYPSNPGNSNNWDFQFAPELAPDGRGGVFLLYYAAQFSGARKLPCAVLYESGATTGPQVVLSTATRGNGYAGVIDYLGIVWNPILLVAHAVWTEYAPTIPGPGNNQMGIYSTRISAGGASANPALGDLGFSNQRRIVMTGNTTHLVGFGELTPSTTINKKHAIWYSEQKQTGNGSTTDWTGPLELDNHDFDDYIQTTGTKKLLSQANGSSPSVAVYERSTEQSSDPDNQKAVAVVWYATPPSNVSWIAYRGGCVYIRVKEFPPCESGGITDWSPLDSTGISDAPVAGIISPVVAPLTAPITGTNKRYLIGWVVTFACNNRLESYTYLRYHQNSGGWVHNENWGPHKGYWTQNIGVLVDDGTLGPCPGNGHNRLLAGDITGKHGSFVSVTSNESNGNGLSSGGANADVTPTMSAQDIVFTADGTQPNTGVWNLTAWYNTAATLTLGELVATGIPPLAPDPCNPPLISFSLDPVTLSPTYTYHVTGGSIWYGFLGKPSSFDRNPSITITSTGQRVAAWEHMNPPLFPTSGLPIGGAIVGGSTPFPCPMLPMGIYSSIRIRQTQNDGTWGTWSPVNDVIYATATDLGWTWLRNPSVTAFPKTPDAPHNSSAYDPGAAELLFWQQKKLDIISCTVTMPNVLHERRFWQAKQGNLWSGQWNPNDNPDPIGWGNPYPNGYSGANAQRSFGIYNNGPQWPSSFNGTQLPSNTLKDRDGNPYLRGLSYGLGNAVVSGVPQPTLCNPIPDVGAFKLGTFDTALGVEFYRSETRVKDSSTVTFKWGKVWVEDTVFGIPIREVMLHNGIPDSTFVSHDAIRDSIFATEWFNWPVSAEIKYDRLMLFPRAGKLYFNIDTTVAYDTLGDSVLVFDTVPGTFIADTTQRTDSCFISPVVSMKYTVELVHQNGNVDMVENLIYDPYDSLYIWPRTVHIAHSSDAADTVMLRVRGQLTGIPDFDSLVGFERETMLDTYPSWGDTTIAIATGGGILPPPDTCFAVEGPYANPSYPSENDVSILVHYCASGSTISAQVYDYLGYPVGSASTFTSDGQTWDRLPINSPLVSGTFYIVVTVGSYSGTSGYVVY